MLLPRFIRQRDAPGYLGMDRNRFDAEIPLGVRCIAYDRLDLDAWADAYKASYGRPGRKAKVAPPPLEPRTKPMALDGEVEALREAAAKQMAQIWQGFKARQSLTHLPRR